MCSFLNIQLCRYSTIFFIFLQKNPAEENTILIMSERVGKVPAVVVGLSL